MIKASLAAQKINLPALVLERGILMPRETDDFKGYPDTKDMLMKNPFPNIKVKGNKRSHNPSRRLSKIKIGNDLPKTLEHNAKFEYRPSHVGNFPLL